MLYSLIISRINELVVLYSLFHQLANILYLGSFMQLSNNNYFFSERFLHRNEILSLTKCNLSLLLTFQRIALISIDLSANKSNKTIVINACEISSFQVYFT